MALIPVNATQAKQILANPAQAKTIITNQALNAEKMVMSEVNSAQTQAIITAVKPYLPFLAVAGVGLLVLFLVPDIIGGFLGRGVARKGLKSIIKKEGKKDNDGAEGPGEPSKKKTKKDKKTGPSNKGYEFKKWDMDRDLNELPDAPGVYMLKDRDGEILYIGNADSLKKRVNAQLKYETGNTPAELIEEFDTLEYCKTENKEDAKKLEAKLIEEKKPPYNTYKNGDKTRKKAKKSAIDNLQKNKKSTKGDHKWIKLRIREPSEMQKDSYKTDIKSADVREIKAVPKGKEKPVTQSMRFKTKEALKANKSKIEAKYNGKIVKKGEDYKLEPNEPKAKPEKKENKEPGKKPNISEIAQKYNSDIKEGDEVTFNAGRNRKGSGKVKEVTKNTFKIETEGGKVHNVLKTMVRRKK